MIRRVDISYKTVFFIAGFLGVLYILYQIKDVILLLFISIILMSALAPLVEKLMAWKIPKPLAITLIYILLVSVIATLLTIIIVPLVDQTVSLARNLPDILQNRLPPGVNANVIEQRLDGILGDIPDLFITLFSNIISIVSVLVLTFYLLLDRERFEKLLSSFFVNEQPRAKRLIQKIEEKLGAWLRGQVILSVVIGVMSYILLFLFNIPYALPLAILAGIMEVVPVIGPIIAAVPAVLIAYLVSPALGLFIGIGYLAIQQLENHVVVPQVMRRAVGLNPLVVILGIAIGGRLLGISGALLAVPIIVVFQIIAQELLHIDMDTFSPLTEEEPKKTA